MVSFCLINEIIESGLFVRKPEPNRQVPNYISTLPHEGRAAVIYETSPPRPLSSIVLLPKRNCSNLLHLLVQSLTTSPCLPYLPVPSHFTAPLHFDHSPPSSLTVPSFSSTRRLPFFPFPSHRIFQALYIVQFYPERATERP